jgi:type I restriction enzyme S subunit
VLIRPFDSCVLPWFIAYYILSPDTQKNLVEQSTGTTVSHVNLNTFRPYLIPIPPLSEQRRIIAKLTVLLKIADKYGNEQICLSNLNSSIAESLRKSILQAAIQGKLVPQIASEGTAQELLEQIQQEKLRLVKEGVLKKSTLASSVIFKGDDNKYYEKVGRDVIDITEEIPFEIPSTWCWCRVHTIFQINPKNDAEDSAESAFVPMEKIAPGYGSSFIYDTVSWQQIKRGSTHFSDGDIGFAKITPCFQNRKSVIFTGLPNGIGAGTTELKILRVYDNTIDRRFALSFLKSPYFIEQATFKGTANQQRIVSGYLENKLFPLPPINEQKMIVERMEDLFNQLK